MDYQKISAMGFAALLWTGIASADIVGVFSDPTSEPIKFAVGDIKTALEAKGHTVQMLDIGTLSNAFANKKVVIGLASQSAVVSSLTAQGGTAPAGLGEQAYALRTTTQGQTSFWAIGGDVSGAMYGALQLAENISSDGLTGVYNSQEAPFMKQRGMKLNLPLDKRIPTYVGSWTARSAKKAIPQVWDMQFWKTLIDQQARSRYNMISVWVHHPFPALVQMPEYPKASLPKIEGFDGYDRPDLTHENRVKFWREVMQYSHDRGMSFYFFNWNIYVDYAKDQGYNLGTSINDAATKTYLYKCLQALIKTYPELDGFGLSLGDGMSGPTEAAKQSWSWDVYGKAVKDYLDANKDRKFNLIHRSLGISPQTFFPSYEPLIKTPNARVDFSVKYAMAHMYSTPAPRWTADINDIAKSYPTNKTYLTVRNDDYYYINWGDPKFVRDFMAGVPNKDNVIGMYIGADGWSPTKAYFVKDASKTSQFEVERRWYMEMLWGRLAYNPQTSDEILKKLLASKYKMASADNLFNAWALASRPLPKMTELIMGDWELDHHWWPEACWSDPGRHEGFRTIGSMATATTVANGSDLCDIKTSAANGCGAKKSSYATSNEMQSDAEASLKMIGSIPKGQSSELDVAIKNVTQMAFLSNYYAFKVRGSTYKQAIKTDSARVAMGKAYCYWMVYTRSMEEMYVGDSVRNVEIYPDWKFGDVAVLKEYSDLGGSGTPNCSDIVTVGISNSEVNLAQKISVLPFNGSVLQFILPEGGKAQISLFGANGSTLLKEFTLTGKAGMNEIKLTKSVKSGIHFVRIKSGKHSHVEKIGLATISNP